MLAAVQATDEQLIALQYQMQIFTDLAFSSLAQKDDSHWRPSLVSAVTIPALVCPQKTNNRAAVHYMMLLMAMSPYLMFINNVTVMSL